MREVPLDDGLLLVGQKIVAQRNQVTEQVAARPGILQQTNRAGVFSVLSGNVGRHRETTAEILNDGIGGSLIVDLGDFPPGTFFARLAKLLGDKLQDTPQRVALCRRV